MIEIRGAGLTATVDAARGAKITSLLDHDGVEWLAQGTGEVAPAGVAFTDAEMAGWDECAPSIVECIVDGRPIPDHGDLWDVPFEVDGTTVRAIGTSLDYEFERRIDPTAAGLRLSYRASVRSGSIPFLWAAHPQFLAPPGTRVEVPGVTAGEDVLAEPRQPILWTPEVATIDTVPDGGCRKVYAAPDRPVTAADLVRPDGRRLRMTWSANCPYLGIWFDQGTYSREPVIAIEPSTGYYDSLAMAIELERVARIEPGGPLEWYVDLVVTR